LSVVAGVITSAGSSRRWGGSEKKEYAGLQGRPVLAHAVLPFLEIDPDMLLVLTVPPGHTEQARSLLEPHLPSASLRFVEGGPSRQASVHLGLETLRDLRPEIVLIHDGARPWVSAALIRRVLEATRLHGACIPVLEPSEAPKLVGPSGVIVADLSRRLVQFAQTPQGFIFQRILEAHRRASGGSRIHLDDAEVYAAFCGPVYTVPGEPANRKITYPRDLLGEALQ
jgi:2-C-methyl-D-erythritol 4-phosphate cytidylyltransferase